MTNNAPEYDMDAFEARQKLDRALNTPTLALREIREYKARAEAAEAAIQAALERLDASLFSNSEHQQAKDILRAALSAISKEEEQQ
jgi:hypothetical protein